MKLVHYLKELGISPYSARSMASELGISVVSLGHIATGKRAPSGRLAFRIEDYTKGLVTARELLVEKEEVEA